MTVDSPPLHVSPWTPRVTTALAVLAAAAFVYVTAEIMPVGALPAIARDLRVSEALVGTLLASYALGRGFEVGGRFRYSTGMPRTPVTGSFLGLDGYSEPTFGAHNSTRIPAFYQLDVRGEKTFVMQRMKLSVFVDVQNVTNRKSPEEIIYSQDYKQKSYIIGLPTLAVVGARLEF